MPKSDQHGPSHTGQAPTHEVDRPPLHHSMPVPNGGEFDLIRDNDTWAFRDADDALVTRRLRVWLDGNGGLIAVVTEAGTGTCITDAAAQIHHQLTAVEYPGRRLRLFEHWPADADEGADEQFDEVLVDGAGEVTWMSMPAGPFATLLRLPPPERSRNPLGRVVRHRVFGCFDQGSVLITDPHGGPLGVLEVVASATADHDNDSHQLAAALLATVTGLPVVEPALVAMFAQTVIAELPINGWRLGDAQITGWLNSQSQRRLVS